MANTPAYLSAIITANNTKFKKGIGGAQKSLGGFSKTVSGIKSQIAGMLAVGGLAVLIKDSVELAAKAQGIQTAFSRINDPNLLSRLRDSVKGTVSDVRLMQAAVKANNFKIPLEQLGTFFQFAQQRAIETGESVDYLVESIINGIARKSLPILDNLGLSATEVREEFNKTGDMASAVGNIIERDLGDGINTAQEDIDRFKVAIENLKLSIGEMTTETGLLTKGLGFFSDALLQAQNYSLNLKRASKLTEEEQKRLFELYMKFSNDAGKELQALVKKYEGLGVAATTHSKTLRDELKDIGFSGKHLDVIIGQIVEHVIEANTVFAKTAETSGKTEEQIKAEYEAWKTLNDELVKTREAKEALNDIDIELKAGMNEVLSGMKGTHEEFKASLPVTQELTGSIFDFGLSLDEAEERVEELDVDNAVTQFETLKQAAQELSQDIKTAMAGVASAFASGVGAAMAGAQSLGEALKEIAVMIIEAIGDILIYAGVGLGIPAGLPLILGGLAMKGISAFGQAKMSQMSMQPSVQGVSSGYGGSMIYGNNIYTANRAATRTNQRIG